MHEIWNAFILNAREYSGNFLSIEILLTILVISVLMQMLQNFLQHRRLAGLMDKVRRQRGKMGMDKWSPQTKERREYVKQKVADAITDALEELYFSDELSRDEVNREYKRFGNLFSMPDFIPRCEKILKERIRERLSNKEKIYKPVPFPSEGEGETEQEVKETNNPFLLFLNRRHAA